MNFFSIIAILVTLLTSTTASNNVRGSANMRELEDEDENAELELETHSDEYVEYSQIKLSGLNVVSPFRIAPNSVGIANLVIFKHDSEYYMDLVADVLGFIPGQLHLHKSTVADYEDSIAFNFSPFINHKSQTFSKGSLVISERLFKDIKAHPDDYYLDAHVGLKTQPVNTYTLSIRGQLMERVNTKLLPKYVVSPYVGKEGASGSATISIESAGERLCLDATVTGFDPKSIRLVKGAVGAKGSTVATFTSTRQAPGRYLNCITSSVDLAQDLIHSPGGYFLMFHETIPGTGEQNYKYAIRGQMKW